MAEMNCIVFGTVKDVGGVVASWLEHSTPVRALAGNFVLCFWAKHFTLTLPLCSTQAYKWVSGNLMPGGNPVMD